MDTIEVDQDKKQKRRLKNNQLSLDYYYRNRKTICNKQKQRYHKQKETQLLIKKEAFIQKLLEEQLTK